MAVPDRGEGGGSTAPVGQSLQSRTLAVQMSDSKMPFLTFNLILSFSVHTVSAELLTLQPNEGRNQIAEVKSVKYCCTSCTAG